MTQLRVQAPKFKLSFFLPKYWPTWIAVILLYAISWLPYRVQVWLGKGLGQLLKVLAKKRCHIAKRNIRLCFPDWTEIQRQQLFDKHLDSAGLAILEAGMGWWWPDWRVKGIGEVEGLEHIQRILDQGKGVLALAIHNMNLEMGCRVIGLRQPCSGFYRQHNNPIMEYMQFHGRSRSNRYMIPKRNISGLITALNEGEVCLYLPDQDYGRKRCEFVPFFAVQQAATTTGSTLFAGRANCETVFIMSQRTKDGYKAIILPGLENFPSGDDNYDVARVNRQVESMVMRSPEQYLWMHKRFKTRPNPEDVSLYE